MRYILLLLFLALVAYGAKILYYGTDTVKARIIMVTAPTVNRGE